MSFKDYSIKVKVIVLIVSISSIALIVSAIIFFAYDKASFKSNTKRSISILAEIIGQNNTANLTFPVAGETEAQQMLSTLTADKHIKHAIVFNQQGVQFAEYVRDSTYVQELKKLPYPSDTAFFSDTALIVTHRIVFRGHKIGTMYIESDLKEYDERGMQFLGVLAIILATASLVALGLAFWLHRFISNPKPCFYIRSVSSYYIY